MKSSERETLILICSSVMFIWMMILTFMQVTLDTDIRRVESEVSRLRDRLDWERVWRR